jgi:hypothetical protein
LATEKEKLYGTWRLVSDVRQDVETGAMTANFGKHPQGFLTYGQHGRMSAIEVAEQRPSPADLSKLTDVERAALFKTMLAWQFFPHCSEPRPWIRPLIRRLRPSDSGFVF